MWGWQQFRIYSYLEICVLEFKDIYREYYNFPCVKKERNGEEFSLKSKSRQAAESESGWGLCQSLPLEPYQNPAVT